MIGSWFPFQRVRLPFFGKKIVLQFFQELMARNEFWGSTAVQQLSLSVFVHSGWWFACSLFQILCWSRTVSSSIWSMQGSSSSQLSEGLQLTRLACNGNKVFNEFSIIGTQDCVVDRVDRIFTRSLVIFLKLERDYVLRVPPTKYAFSRCVPRQWADKHERSRPSRSCEGETTKLKR